MMEILPTGHTPLTTSQKKWKVAQSVTLKPRSKSTLSLYVSIVPILSLSQANSVHRSLAYCWDFIFDIPNRTVVQ